MMQGLPSGKDAEIRETTGTGKKKKELAPVGRNPMIKEVTSAKPILFL